MNQSFNRRGSIRKRRNIASMLTNEAPPSPMKPKLFEDDNKTPDEHKI
jgi:hypothetical protein